MVNSWRSIKAGEEMLHPFSHEEHSGQNIITSLKYLSYNIWNKPFGLELHGLSKWVISALI